MAEPDSWEEMDSQPSHSSAAASSMHSKLNANAPSFTFNVKAPAFSPVPNAYFPAQPSTQQAFFPTNPVNSTNPQFVNPTSPVQPISPTNPSAGLPPQNAPGAVSPYVQPSYPPAVDHQVAARNDVASKIETLQHSERERDETRPDLTDKDVEMEVDGGSAQVEAKEAAAANGESNGALRGIRKFRVICYLLLFLNLKMNYIAEIKNYRK